MARKLKGVWERKKNKTLVFRRKFLVHALLGTVPVEELTNRLVEDCFSRGYVPFRPKHNIERWYGLVHANDVVFTFAAYAGKRAAREIGVQEWPDMTRGIPLLSPEKK